MKPRLFVDMDGVLADFDAAYAAHFGAILDRLGAEPPDLWDNIKSRPNWYEELAPLPGAIDFFAAMRPYGPTVLSGINLRTPDATGQKRRWLDRHLGADIPLITCKSKDKRDHGQPGDILVDDWPKYRHRWEAMGGTFILHNPKDPDASVRAVRALLD